MPVDDDDLLAEEDDEDEGDKVRLVKINYFLINLI